MSHSLVPEIGKSTDSICSTPKCQETAKSILNYVDFNIDPCSDFYQYTCGSWLKNNTIPDDKSSTGTFDTGNDNILYVLRQILEGSYEDIYKNLKNGDEGFHTEAERETDKEHFNKMKQYYNLCMNTDTMDKLGPTPIYPEISSIQSSIIPVSQDNEIYSPEKIKQLADIITFQGTRGKNSLFSMGVRVDDKNPNQSVIVVSQAALTLTSKEYYEKPDVAKKYAVGLTKILTAVLGEPEGNSPDSNRIEISKKYRLQLWSQEKIQNAVNDFITFETTLANMSQKKDELRDPVAIYNPVSLIDFQKQNPLIDWKSIFRALVPPEIPLPDRIIIKTPEYFKKLNMLLSSGIKMKTLQNYFIIRHVNNYVSLLDSKSRAASRELVGSIMSGTSVEQPRWRTCSSFASDIFSEMLGRYYVLKSFGSESDRKKIEIFLDALYEAWLNKIPSAEWLDPITKGKAIEKLNSIKRKVAYSTISPDIRSPKSLALYFDGLDIDQTSYFNSEIGYLVWQRKKSWKDLGKPVDKNEWGMTPQTVNAYYSPTNNEIAVPAGILQPPFYDTEYPEFLNYGGIGTIIGHELSHAFDDSGRKYDSNGNLAEWWTNTTSSEFDKKTQCFIDQYSKFNITGPDGKAVNINGKLTLGENIADNGGISAALLAYQKLRPYHETPEQRLVGLEKLSVEQLFFINFGKLWCELVRPEFQLRLILSDPHSLSQARINGAMQNSVEFSKAFNCPSGSSMNPINKCSIW